jgi:hypothetical protein
VNLTLVEEIKEETHIYKGQQLEEPAQEVVFNYLHHAEVVVQCSLQWQDMIPPFSYNSFEESQHKTLRRT